MICYNESSNNLHDIYIEVNYTVGTEFITILYYDLVIIDIRNARDQVIPICGIRTETTGLPIKRKHLHAMVAASSYRGAPVHCVCASAYFSTFLSPPV